MDKMNLVAVFANLEVLGSITQQDGSILGPMGEIKINMASGASLPATYRGIVATVQGRTREVVMVAPVGGAVNFDAIFYRGAGRPVEVETRIKAAKIVLENARRGKYHVKCNFFISGKQAEYDAVEKHLEDLEKGSRLPAPENEHPEPANTETTPEPEDTESTEKGHKFQKFWRKKQKRK